MSSSNEIVLFWKDPQNSLSEKNSAYNNQWNDYFCFNHVDQQISDFQQSNISRFATIHPLTSKSITHTTLIRLRQNLNERVVKIFFQVNFWNEIGTKKCKMKHQSNADKRKMDTQNGCMLLATCGLMYCKLMSHVL